MNEKALEPLFDRLMSAASVKNWADADAQRREAAEMIVKLHNLLVRGYGYIEDWQSESQESMLAKKLFLNEINAALDAALGPHPATPSTDRR